MESLRYTRLLIIIPDKKSNMGKKRKLEDPEIQKIVAREKILNISKRKLKKVSDCCLTPTEQFFS
jgi:hypothetical protein